MKLPASCLCICARYSDHHKRSFRAESGRHVDSDLQQTRYRINSKPGHATVEPEAHRVVHGLPALGDCASSDRAVLCKSDGSNAVLSPGSNCHAEWPNHDCQLWEAGPAPCRRATHTVALRIRTRRARFRKPGMLFRRMIRHKIHDHADVALLRFAYQSIEVRESTVERIDGRVIRDVVAKNPPAGRRVHGANPDGVDSQVPDVNPAGT